MNLGRRPGQNRSIFETKNFVACEGKKTGPQKIHNAHSVTRFDFRREPVVEGGGGKE